MDLEDLRVDFNAVLTSGGGSLSERQFLADFRSLIGKTIPYRALGCSDVRSLLQKMGGYYFTNRGGDLVIHSQGDEKTAHIASLIARQRKKPGKPKLRRSNNYSYRPSKPLPLRHVEVRRYAPSTPVVYSRTQRQPPPPRFGNPPIIPQRQPLSNAQSRLERGPITNVPEEQKRKVPEEQKQRVPEEQKQRVPEEQKQRVPEEQKQRVPEQQKQRVPEEQKQRVPEEQKKKILNGKSTPDHDDNSNSKVQQFVEEAQDETEFVDIQWLQAKVMKEKVKKTVTTPVNSEIRSTSITPEQSGPTLIFTSHIDELASIASKLGLEPKYKEIKRKPSSGRPLFLSKVKIGVDSFSSYPDEKPTAEEAMQLVAKLACEALKTRLNKTAVEEQRLTSSELINRLYEIVKPKSNGLFDQAVQEAYENLYKTCIPVSWVDTIKNSGKFSIERFNDSRCIIYPVTEGPLGFNTNGPLSTSKDLDPVKVSDVVSPPTTTTLCTSESTPAPKCNGFLKSSANIRLSKDINANTVTVTDSKPRTLPGLVLPVGTNHWDVYVASVGANDIWVRLIGDDYDAKYNDVMTDLELKMVTHDEIVETPQVDDFYCIKCDSCYIRVQLKGILSEGECEVFLVDNGETDTVSLSDLRVLSTEAMSLPAQAIQCRLSYTDLSYEVAQTYLMNHVIGCSFVATVVKMPSSSNNLANIVLYNTDDENQSVNINSLILEEILRKLDSPQLTQRHCSFVRVTSVEAESSPYVQVQGKDLSFLEAILQEIHDNLDLVDLHGLNAHPRIGTNCEKMYLCKSKQTWRRGTICSMDDPRNPTVYFVDYGHKESVMLQDIFDLEKVLPPLQRFPPQAVQVNLVGLPPSKLSFGVVHRLVELAPPHIFIISKCVEIIAGKPEIELFKRVQPDNMIASINTDLTFNYEEYSKKTVEDLPITSNSSPQRGPPGCTNPLTRYPLPSVDCYFDVSISMSSNPFNFVVQPLKNRPAFDTMMQELQELYETQHSVMPSPAIEELIENAAFVAKHPEDLMWYRVSIVTALSDSMVSVRYSDWGDVGLVPIDQLRYMEPRFRTIPMLAIRAKLHGVKPKENAEWTVTQCLYFNELVDSKSFVSKVMDTNPENNFNSWQLSLALIDTSACNVDVDIGELLLRDKVAETVQSNE